MSQWVKLIHRYGAWLQYSARRYEQAYKTNVKEGWNVSNNNHNHLPQVITVEHFILGLEI
jgi:hypothetical protein